MTLNLYSLLAIIDNQQSVTLIQLKHHNIKKLYWTET